MLNVLKIDFYKAFRTVSFWVISVLNILFVVFSSFLMFSIYVTALNEPSEFSDIILQNVLPFFKFIPRFIPQCTFLIGIFAVMFAVSEFSYGTIKNIASKGYRREFIYLSKFITALVVAIVNILLSFATSFITAQIMINNRLPEFFNIDNTFWETVGKNSLQLLAYLSIAIFLAMFFRSLGSSLAIFLAFVFLESSAAALINQLFKDVLKLEFTVDPYTIFGAFGDSDQLVRGVIVLLVYIAVATVVGIYTFKQRDIN